MKEEERDGKRRDCDPRRTDGKRPVKREGNCNCNCSILGRMKLGYLNVMSSIYLPRGGKCKGQRSLGF